MSWTTLITDDNNPIKQDLYIKNAIVGNSSGVSNESFKNISSTLSGAKFPISLNGDNSITTSEDIHGNAFLYLNSTGTGGVFARNETLGNDKPVGTFLQKIQNKDGTIALTSDIDNTNNVKTIYSLAPQGCLLVSDFVNGTRNIGPTSNFIMIGTQLNLNTNAEIKCNNGTFITIDNGGNLKMLTGSTIVGDPYIVDSQIAGPTITKKNILTGNIFNTSTSAGTITQGRQTIINATVPLSGSDAPGFLYQTGGITSIIKSATGQYDINFVTYASPPYIQITPVDGLAPIPTSMRWSLRLITPSSCRVVFYDPLTSAGIDYSFNIYISGQTL
jgi:hypothetical protein